MVEDKIPQMKNGFDAHWFQALLAEYNMLRTEQNMHLQSYHRDLKMMALVAGAFIAFITLEKPILKIEILVVLIPTIFFVFILAQISNQRVIKSIAKATIKIERKVNDLFIIPPMEWESRQVKEFILSKWAPLKFLQIALNVILGLLFVIAAIISHAEFGISISVLHIFEIIVIILVLVLESSFNKSIYD